MSMFKRNDLVRSLAGGLYLVADVHVLPNGMARLLSLVNIKTRRITTGRNPRAFTLVGRNYKELAK